MTKSQYGDRDTVGTMALKAREFHTNPCVGDLAHELMPGLVEDLNLTIKSNPYDTSPFYIIIHEKKDGMHNNMMLRRMLTSKKRPFPEDNTTVFWTDPKSNTTKFCWALPHKAVFPQVLLNPDRYGQEQVADVKAFMAKDFEHFGLKYMGVQKTEKGNVDFYLPIPGFKDRDLPKGRKTA